jgi:hypothetical protein
MGLAWDVLLKPYQDSPTGGRRYIEAIRAMLIREGNAPDAADLAITIVGNRLQARMVYENGAALVQDIKNKAREITQEAHRRMYELFEEGLDSLALQKNAEAIGEQYAVADEAAGLVALADARTAASGQDVLKWTEAHREADTERLSLHLRQRGFLEAPLWARLWWAFRGRLG